MFSHKKHFTAKTLFIAAALFVVSHGTLAATCTAFSPNTDPDATLTDAAACGLGSGNSDSEALVNQQEPGTALWTLYDKTDGDLAGDAAELMIAGITFDDGKPSSGTWAIDTTLSLSNHDFLLVIKDGATIGNVNPKWFWFIVDEPLSHDGCGAGIELCGTWQMYGTAGGNARKGLSHMSLYVTEGGETPPEEIPPPSIPEPSALALAGIGLVSLMTTRWRKTGVAA